jgi:hypothetical protein
MPRIRWVDWKGRRWRLSELAVAYDLKPQTLASRLDRGLRVERALATGICTASEAGRRGFAAGWGLKRRRPSRWPRARIRRRTRDSRTVNIGADYRESDRKCGPFLSSDRRGRRNARRA